MKLCKDCEDFDGVFFCRSQTNGINPVNGYPRSLFAVERRCSYNLFLYSEIVPCGPEAIHFRPKEIKPKKLWWKFW